MSLSTINKVCYTLCVVSVCGSAVSGLLIVWLEAFESGWRVLMSFLILLLAAATMIAVNTTLARPRPPRE